MISVRLDFHRLLSAWQRWRCRRDHHKFGEPEDIRVLMDFEGREWRTRWFEEFKDAQWVVQCRRCGEPRKVAGPDGRAPSGRAG